MTTGADTAAADQVLAAIIDRIDDPRPLLEFLGTRLLEHEKLAFATAGFGTWAPLDPATIRAKGSARPLVDDGDLLRSLTRKSALDFAGDAVTIATNERSARHLQGGDRGMPKRNPTPEPTPADTRRWAEEALGFLVAGETR